MIFLQGCCYCILEPELWTVREFEFKDEDIPDAFDGTKIVFIADIHLGSNITEEKIAYMVETVNQLAPDIIILGGDYAYKSAAYFRPCFKELGELRPVVGKYGVLGNHDHWYDAELASECMIDAGIEQLDNKAVWIEKDGAKIKIGGVGDLWTDTQNIAPTIEDAEPDDFVILVSHNPDFAETLDTDKIDLMFSGHTHGGQVSLFGIWTPWVPSRYGGKYRSGMIDAAKTKVLVSNGFGTTAVPFRFTVRPDILLVRLKTSH
ncbi:MAG: metallophosphoesterase [Planctomycetes bacterium]|nr:metallophosphoesterase [Planctomycetota bacterium]